MNLQKIKKLCLKSGKCLIVEDRHGGQWIGIESALYPVTGLQLDEKSLKIIWQLTDKQAGEMDFETRQDLEGFLDTGMVLDESQVQVMEKATINDVVFMGYEADEGQVLLAQKEMLETAWVKGEWTRYQLKPTNNGAVLVTFCGLMVTGVIKPMKDGLAQKWMDSVAALCQRGTIKTGEATVWNKVEF